MTKLYRVHQKVTLTVEGFVEADSAAEAIRLEEEGMAEMPWENAPFTVTKVKAEEVFGVNPWWHPGKMPRPYCGEYTAARKILFG